MLRVYLDTVITSGRVQRDLSPVSEMAAVDRLEQLHAEERIKIVTSKWSRVEQERTKNPERRAAFAARANEVSMVQSDHKLLGFNSIDYGRRGFISYPLISDVVNDDLLARLKAASVEHDDAMHVMYAVENNCQVFVTLDDKDLLPRRAAIEGFCSGIRILRPTELVEELEGDPSATSF